MDFFQRASICARDIQFERHTRKKGLVPGQKYDTIPPYMGLIRSIQEFWLSTSRRAASLVLTPVLDRALHTDSKNIHRFRQRQALAETAAFVDEHMASVRSFPDAFTLLTHSMQKTEGIDGPVCEFGVASGRSINHIAKFVPHETVFGFDSFDGLPEDWQGVMPKGTFRRKELPAVRDNVSLIRGLFADTLGSFLEDHAAPVKLLHVDCDLYSSTKTIFERLEARIQPGSVIIFDEYFNYAGRQQHEYKAFADLVQRTGWSFEYLGYCRYGSQVAVRIGPMESSKTGCA